MDGNNTDRARRGRWLRRCGAVWLVAAAAVALPRTGGAQASGAAESQEQTWTLGAGAGWTYYCIVSRCDSGTTLYGLVAYSLLPTLRVEAVARRHGCADCGRFLVVEGGARLGLPLGRIAPFLSGGGGLSSDPEFMGNKGHGYVGVGSSIRTASDRWSVDVEVRGRQLGIGNRMVETAVGFAYRVGETRDRRVIGEGAHVGARTTGRGGLRP